MTVCGHESWHIIAYKMAFCIDHKHMHTFSILLRKYTIAVLDHFTYSFIVCAHTQRYTHDPPWKHFATLLHFVLVGHIMEQRSPVKHQNDTSLQHLELPFFICGPPRLDQLCWLVVCVCEYDLKAQDAV